MPAKPENPIVTAPVIAEQRRSRRPARRPQSRTAALLHQNIDLRATMCACRAIKMRIFLVLACFLAIAGNAPASSGRQAVPSHAFLLKQIYGFEVEKDSHLLEDDYQYHTREPFAQWIAVWFAHPFRQGGVDRFIALTAKVQNAEFCHACQPMIGGITLSLVKGRWQVDAVNPAIDRIGFGGNPPYSPEFVQIGARRAGVMSRELFTGQGVTAGGLVLIGEVGKTVEVLVEDGGTIENNLGHCRDESIEDPQDAGYPYPCYALDASYKLVPTGQNQSSDLEITVAGTRYMDEAGVKPYKMTRRYVFVGCYVPIDESVPAADGPVTIQAGAYHSYPAACRQLNIIRELKLPASVDLGRPTDDPALFRLRIGGFADWKAARDAMAKLKARGIDAFVVPGKKVP